MVRRSLCIGRMAAAIALAVALLVLTPVLGEGPEEFVDPCADVKYETAPMDLPAAGDAQTHHMAFCFPGGQESVSPCKAYIQERFGAEDADEAGNQLLYTGEEELDLTSLGTEEEVTDAEEGTGTGTGAGTEEGTGDVSTDGGQDDTSGAGEQRKLPECPEVENYNNVVDYLTEVETLFDDLIEFYEPFVDELKALRDSFYAQQAKCHGRINRFASRYGVPCEMEPFAPSDDAGDEGDEEVPEEEPVTTTAEEEEPYTPSEGIEGDLMPEEKEPAPVYEPDVTEAHPLEALVIGDGFGPELCYQAVAETCLADEAWKCKKGSGHLPAAVRTCSMCVAEDCETGTGCGTCGEKDDDEEESDGPEPTITEITTDAGWGADTTYPVPEDGGLTETSDPFGVKGCEPKDLDDGRKTYLATEKGKHANVDRIALQQCQQDAVDVKDVCTLDGSGTFLGDDGAHGPTEVIARLDVVISDMQDFVHTLKELTDEVHKMAEETRKKLDDKDAIIWPTEGHETSPFGQRDALCADTRLCKPHVHKGYDIAESGTVPVVAAAAGKVASILLASSGGCYGNAVFIDHSNSLQTRYAHLRHIDVTMSQVVEQGERIGLMGTTGCSTGQHLHFEIRVNGVATDPKPVLEGSSNIFLLFHEAELFTAMSKNADKVEPTQEGLKALVLFLKEYVGDIGAAGGMSATAQAFLVQSSEGWSNAEDCDASFPALFEGEECTELGEEDGEEDGTGDEDAEEPEEEQKPDDDTSDQGPPSHLDDCPPQGKRGGCYATVTSTSISDGNTDAWSGDGLANLLALAAWDPEGLFLTDGMCFGYDTTSGGGNSYPGSSSPGSSSGSTPGATPDGAAGEIPPGEDVPGPDAPIPGEDGTDGGSDSLTTCCQRIYDVEGTTWSGGAIAYAAGTWLGVPYVNGGTSRDGVDGAGLVLAVMREVAVELPRTPAAQHEACEANGGGRVGWRKLRPGDVVFLRGEDGEGVVHAGIFTGDDSLVHASQPDGIVTVSRLSDPAYKDRWGGACRLGPGARASTGISVSWCTETVDELCCRGPGLEPELPITEEGCGLSCEELCDGKYARHSTRRLVCRHACGLQDEQCAGKGDESACEVDGVQGLCCDDQCMVHALMCAGRVDACVGRDELASCSFDNKNGVCCGGRCLTGGEECTACPRSPVWVRDPNAGGCTRFESTCDVPAGWTDCDGFGCTGQEDGTACTVAGAQGQCCGGSCAVGATGCVPDTACGDDGKGLPCLVGQGVGTCCGGNCAVGASSCMTCEQVDTYAKDPLSGKCVRFPSPCDAPYGWSACPGHGCVSADDGAECSIDGASGLCCGGGCVAGANGCEDVPSLCADTVEGGVCEVDGPTGVCCGGSCATGGKSCGACPEVVTFALNPGSGACVRFASSCDRPRGWPPCLAASCLTECQNAYPERPALAQACRQRCEGADIACELRCIDQFPLSGARSMCFEGCPGVASPSMPEGLRHCELGCLTSSDDLPEITLCLQMCRAVHPRIHASLALVRDGQEAESFHTGERPRLHLTVENRGGTGFTGKVDVVLEINRDCACSVCPVGDDCPCDCSVEELVILTTTQLVVGPGQKQGVLTDPVELGASLAGTTVRPVATVRDAAGKIVGEPHGPFYGIGAPGKLTVADAWFTVGGRERATTGHPGEEAFGAVSFTTQLVPVSLTIYLVGWDGTPVIGTERTHEIAWPVKESTFTSAPLDITGTQADLLFRIGYRVEGGGTTLAEGILLEQGRAADLCTGPALLTWCEGLHERVRLSYPRAFLEVRRPALVVTDAAFVDDGGSVVGGRSAARTVRVRVELANQASSGFTGTVTIAIIGDDGLAITESEREVAVDRGLDDRGSTMTAESAPVDATPGMTLRVRVTAHARDGAVWLDEVVPTVLFPMAGLNIPQSATGGIARNDVFTSMDHEGCRARVACVQCLSTCELRIERGRCTVTPYNCDCDCILEAIA
ncbi:MAG: peptidoglycan DD-metalloendopeptidase family protein [Candidatus Undinarchaeales archaeon]|nr:peptidoglycan DD-metalloendopeptidase family protein [Candidatus Undinarchaeales archaeon]MDP7494087.1 peptidoglycan DD-metalloendopeptidase family protein [Candidatus Undinarchaeales archaeon]